MVKIISKEPVPAGLYYLEAVIGYGEHCDDIYTSNASPIDDKNAEKFKNGEEIYTAGWRDYRTFFSFSDAEATVKLVKRIFEKLLGHNKVSIASHALQASIFLMSLSVIILFVLEIIHSLNNKYFENQTSSI